MTKIVSLLCVAGCAAALAVPALAAGPTVRVDDNYFKAKTVNITRGTTVTWRWRGSRRHDVVFRRTRSKLKRSGTFRHKFNRRGTYRYVCSLHSDDGMRGKVVVR